MPLTTVVPPESALTAARKFLETLAGIGAGTPRIRAIPLHDLALSLPHPVFDLGLPDAAKGDLGRARLVAWRYLVVRGSDPIAAVEVAVSKGAVREDAVSVNEGMTVAGTARATRVAEAVMETEAGPRELRLLRVAALYVDALWLKATGGEGGQGGDLMIPIAGSPTSLGVNRPAPSKEFTNSLAKLARERLRFGDPTATRRRMGRPKRTK